MKQALRISLATLVLAGLFAASQQPDASAESEQDSAKSEQDGDGEEVLACSWGVVTCPGKFWQIIHTNSNACASECGGPPEFPTRAAALAHCDIHCDAVCQYSPYTLCPI